MFSKQNHVKIFEQVYYKEGVVQLETKKKSTLYPEYKIFLAISLLFVAAAFILDKPADIFNGLGAIFSSRGLLRTDYMVVGGVGAALISSALVSFYAVGVLYIMGAKPTGAALMTLWMSAGWTCWGANVLSIMPLTLGVWLYSCVKKKPFSDFMVAALLCNAIAPIVSVFYVSNPIMLHVGANWPLIVNIAFGVVVGLVVGFFLPAILSGVTRMHDGYTLYNMGVAGGMIALLVTAGFKVAGIEIATEAMWYADKQLEIAIFLYVVFAALIAAGLLTGREKKTNHIKNIKGIIAQSGHAPNDFYSQYGATTYINMGLLGAIGTTVTLLLGSQLNGATFACIFSMVAFGSCGKHITNVLPVMLGAIGCALINTQPVAAPANILPILFCTCLAPIAGEFGWFWGMVTGFLHVLTVAHVGGLTNGFDLYTNGFASGFVALILVPVILAFRKEKKAK